MKKIRYILKSFIVGTVYYFENYSYGAMKNRELSNKAHSPEAGLDETQVKQWNLLHDRFMESYPRVTGLLLSLVSIVISIIALFVALFK